MFVSWNRHADLQIALASVAKQAVEQHLLEVIVVENGSTDATLAVLRQQAAEAAWPFELRLHETGANLGASRGRNIGIRLARSPLVAFIDSDAELLGADVLPRLLEALQAAPQVAAVAPAIYFDAACERPWLLGGQVFRGGYYDPFRSVVETAAPVFLSTCCSLWRKAALEQVHGFDSSYPYVFEDLDLCLRTAAAGWSLAVEPEARVHHRISAEGRVRPEGTLRYYLYIERSRLRNELSRIGLRSFLSEQRWWFGAEGRKFRRTVVYFGCPLPPLLYWFVLVWPVLETLARWPAVRRYTRRAGWLLAEPIPSESISVSSSTPGLLAPHNDGEKRSTPFEGSSVTP